MGTHICFVRSVNLDECKSSCAKLDRKDYYVVRIGSFSLLLNLTCVSLFLFCVSLLPGKEKEIIAMRDGGNALINDLFQANLNGEIKANVRPDCHTDLEQRSKFIYDKYQHRKWYSNTSYNKLQARKKADIAISKLNQNSISEMEEDFFALRGNIGNAGGSNSFVSGKVNDENEWWKTESSNNDNATDGLKKSKKNHTKASDSCKATFLSSDNRRNLMSTLQRMESKSKLLDDIAHLGTSSSNDKKKTKPSDIKRKSTLKKRSENGRHRTRRDSNTKEQENTNGAPSVRSHSRKAPSRSRSGKSYAGDDSFNGSIKDQENTNGAPSVRSHSRKAPSRSRSGKSYAGDDSFNGSIKDQENTDGAPSVRSHSRKAPSRSRSGKSYAGDDSFNGSIKDQESTNGAPSVRSHSRKEPSRSRSGKSSAGDDSFSGMSGGSGSGKGDVIKDGTSQITKEQERKKSSSSDKPHRQNTLGKSRSNDDDSRVTTQSDEIRRHKNGRNETTSSGKSHRRKPPPGRSKSNSVASDALVTNQPNSDSGASRPTRSSRGVKKSKSYDISMFSNRNQCAQRAVDNLSASCVESASIAKEQEQNSLSKDSSRSSSVRSGDREPRKK
ncbi:MAG: hypothetical protein ACI8RD_009707 [Bacillariaceae sp.]|jgi:hypothetical protein